MVRVLAFALMLLVASFSHASYEDSSGRPLIEHRAVAGDQTGLISDAVRERFTLDGHVAKCNFTENLYAYRALLDHFTGETKHLLEAAAEAGRNSGRADEDRLDPTRRDGLALQECADAVDRLRAADDRLLALSENIERN